VQQKLQRNTTT